MAFDPILIPELDPLVRPHATAVSLTELNNIPNAERVHGMEVLVTAGEPSAWVLYRLQASGFSALSNTAKTAALANNANWIAQGDQLITALRVVAANRTRQFYVGIGSGDTASTDGLSLALAASQPGDTVQQITDAVYGGVPNSAQVELRTSVNYDTGGFSIDATTGRGDCVTLQNGAGVIQGRNSVIRVSTGSAWGIGWYGSTTWSRVDTAQQYAVATLAIDYKLYDLHFEATGAANNMVITGGSIYHTGKLTNNGTNIGVATKKAGAQTAAIYEHVGPVYQGGTGTASCAFQISTGSLVIQHGDLVVTSATSYAGTISSSGTFDMRGGILDLRAGGLGSAFRMDSTATIMLTDVTVLGALPGKPNAAGQATGAKVYLYGSTTLPAGTFDQSIQLIDNRPNVTAAQLGFTPENTAQKNVAGGYAGLDANGKFLMASIPAALLGALTVHGIYSFTSNTVTNSPFAAEVNAALPAASNSNIGWLYITADAGTLNGTAYAASDYIVSLGPGGYQKIDRTDAVVTVNSKTGAVVLTKGDVGLSDVDNTSDANKPFLPVTAGTSTNARKLNLDLEVAGNTAIKLMPQVGTGEGFNINRLANGRMRISDPSGNESLSIYSGVDGDPTGGYLAGEGWGVGPTSVTAYTTWLNLNPQGIIRKDYLERRITALPTAPVTSVNARTGAVTLTKNDLGLGNVTNFPFHIEGTINCATGTLYSYNNPSLDDVPCNTSLSTDPSLLGMVFRVTVAGNIPRTGALVGDMFVHEGTRGWFKWATAAVAAGGVTSVNARTGAVTLTKTDVGLGNVDNTSDAAKPVSTATQAALDSTGNVDYKTEVTLTPYTLNGTNNQVFDVTPVNRTSYVLNAESLFGQSSTLRILASSAPEGSVVSVRYFNPGAGGLYVYESSILSAGGLGITFYVDDNAYLLKNESLLLRRHNDGSWKKIAVLNTEPMSAVKNIVNSINNTYGTVTANAQAGADVSTWIKSNYYCHYGNGLASFTTLMDAVNISAFDVSLGKADVTNSGSANFSGATASRIVVRGGSGGSGTVLNLASSAQFCSVDFHDLIVVNAGIYTNAYATDQFGNDSNVRLYNTRLSNGTFSGAKVYLFAGSELVNCTGNVDYPTTVYLYDNAKCDTAGPPSVSGIRIVRPDAVSIEMTYGAAVQKFITDDEAPQAGTNYVITHPPVYGTTGPIAATGSVDTASFLENIVGLSFTFEPASSSTATLRISYVQSGQVSLYIYGESGRFSGFFGPGSNLLDSNTGSDYTAAYGDAPITLYLHWQEGNGANPSAYPYTVTIAIAAAVAERAISGELHKTDDGKVRMLYASRGGLAYKYSYVLNTDTLQSSEIALTATMTRPEALAAFVTNAAVPEVGMTYVVTRPGIAALVGTPTVGAAVNAGGDITQFQNVFPGALNVSLVNNKDRQYAQFDYNDGNSTLLVSTTATHDIEEGVPSGQQYGGAFDLAQNNITLFVSAPYSSPAYSYTFSMDGAVAEVPSQPTVVGELRLDPESGLHVMDAAHVADRDGVFRYVLETDAVAAYPSGLLSKELTFEEATSLFVVSREPPEVGMTYVVTHPAVPAVVGGRTVGPLVAIASIEGTAAFDAKFSNLTFYFKTMPWAVYLSIDFIVLDPNGYPRLSYYDSDGASSTYDLGPGESFGYPNIADQGHPVYLYLGLNGQPAAYRVVVETVAPASAVPAGRTITGELRLDPASSNYTMDAAHVSDRDGVFRYTLSTDAIGPQIVGAAMTAYVDGSYVPVASLRAALDEGYTDIRVYGDAVDLGLDGDVDGRSLRISGNGTRLRPFNGNCLFSNSNIVLEGVCIKDNFTFDSCVLALHNVVMEGATMTGNSTTAYAGTVIRNCQGSGDPSDFVRLYPGAVADSNTNLSVVKFAGLPTSRYYSMANYGETNAVGFDTIASALAAGYRKLFVNRSQVDFTEVVSGNVELYGNGAEFQAGAGAGFNNGEVCLHNLYFACNGMAVNGNAKVKLFNSSFIGAQTSGMEFHVYPGSRVHNCANSGAPSTAYAYAGGLFPTDAQPGANVGFSIAFSSKKALTALQDDGTTAEFDTWAALIASGARRLYLNKNMDVTPAVNGCSLEIFGQGYALSVPSSATSVLNASWKLHDTTLTGSNSTWLDCNFYLYNASVLGISTDGNSAITMYDGSSISSIFGKNNNLDLVVTSYPGSNASAITGKHRIDYAIGVATVSAPSGLLTPDSTGQLALTAANLNLGNVTNTSDAQKVASGPVKDALDLKQDKLLTGFASNSTTTTGVEISGGSNVLDALAVLDARTRARYSLATRYDAASDRFVGYTGMFAAGNSTLEGETCVVNRPLVLVSSFQIYGTLEVGGHRITLSTNNGSSAFILLANRASMNNARVVTAAGATRPNGYNALQNGAYICLADATVTAANPQIISNSILGCDLLISGGALLLHNVAFTGTNTIWLGVNTSVVNSPSPSTLVIGPGCDMTGVTISYASPTCTVVDRRNQHAPPAAAARTAVSGGTFANGELQGAQPAGTTAGAKFADASYRYEVMYSHVDQTTLRWVRTTKA